MENFSGIRFVGNEALTLLAQSIVPHNKGNVDIVRLNPEDMQSPQAMDLIADGLKTFPLRIAAFLKELSAISDHKNADEVFECGQHMLSISDQRLLGIFRKEFDSKYNAGKVDEAVQLFEKYAQRLVSGSTSEHVFEGMRAGFTQLDIKGSGDVSKHQEAMIAKALRSLPEDLVKACDNIGVSIVVRNDVYAASLFANRTISVGPRCFQFGQENLERALKEEMIHYVDSCIRFTHRPEWHAAAEKALGELPPETTTTGKIVRATPEELDEMVRKKEISAADIDQAMAILDRQIHGAHSTMIGKNGIDTYAPHHRHQELLPNIVHAMDLARQEGPDGRRDKEKEIREIYGARAVDLVGAYWQEVKQVAEKKHPALQEVPHARRDFASNVSAKRQTSPTAEL